MACESAAARLFPKDELCHHEFSIDLGMTPGPRSIRSPIRIRPSCLLRLFVTSLTDPWWILMKKREKYSKNLDQTDVAVIALA